MKAIAVTPCCSSRCREKRGGCVGDDDDDVVVVRSMFDFDTLRSTLVRPIKSRRNDAIHVASTAHDDFVCVLFVFAIGLSARCVCGLYSKNIKGLDSS